MEGLPEGVTFKKPCCYGAKQCKSIVEAADSITFEIQIETGAKQSNDNNNQATSQPEASLAVPDMMIRSTLLKVASDVDVGEILSGSKRLSESDINVEDCTLTQDERLTLYTKCRDFFDQESWEAVGHNTKDFSGNAVLRYFLVSLNKHDCRTFPCTAKERRKIAFLKKMAVKFKLE